MSLIGGRQINHKSKSKSNSGNLLQAGCISLLLIFLCWFIRYNENGVLRKLKHIFPNTYQRIKSIRSPAKVGLVVTDLITSPVVSWRGCETPPQYRGSAVILCMTSSEVSGAGGGPSYLFFGKY